MSRRCLLSSLWLASWVVLSITGTLSAQAPEQAPAIPAARSPAAPGQPPAPSTAPEAPAAAPRPPTGPAQIFQRANQNRDRAAVERAAASGEAAAAQVNAPAPAGGLPAHAMPPTAASQPEAPETAPSGAPQAAPRAAPPSDPHGGGDAHAALAEPTLPSATAAPELERGTIEVEVLTPSGQPYVDSEVVLGVMASTGGRTEQRARTGAEGRHIFRNLAVGSQQAYRVNVVYSGAKFSSTPFRLPEHGGYRVRVPLAHTTRSQRMVFQVIGQSVVELRDDRLHITQQARLANAGQDVFVLPADGLLIPLPAGFTAFQWQDQMTDQRAEEEAGKGFRLQGSLPPGSVTLAWTYDLQRAGNSAKIPVNLPFRTYTYRVISEAPEGMTLRATQFPEPERVKDQGRDLMFTQVRRSPSDAEFSSFTIELNGIPGPGPGRWIAALLALIAVGWGLSQAFQRVDDVAARRSVISTRKQQLIEAAKQTEQERASDEIGPEHYARRMEEITTELAMVLRDEEALVSPAGRVVGAS